MDTAKREVLEETGISHIRLADWHLKNQLLPIDIDTHPIPENPKKQEDAHVHHDFRYVFSLDQGQDVSLQLEEVSSAQWKKLSEITKEYNTTTIINTHDMNSVMTIGEKIVYLRLGVKEWEGNKDILINADNKHLIDFVYSSDIFKELRDYLIKNNKTLENIKTKKDDKIN